MIAETQRIEIYNILSKLDSELVVQIFMNAHGSRILDENVLNELIDMGILDEDDIDEDEDDMD